MNLPNEDDFPAQILAFLTGSAFVIAGASDLLMMKLVFIIVGFLLMAWRDSVVGAPR